MKNDINDSLGSFHELQENKKKCQKKKEKIEKELKLIEQFQGKEQKELEKI